MMKTMLSGLNHSGRYFAMIAAVLMAALSAQAQTNLTGRVYANANVMENSLYVEIDKELASIRPEAIAKFKEKKGREPNAKELAEIDKKLKEGRQMINAMKKGMKIAVSVEFKSTKDAVMMTDMKISDEAMKAAGIGWLKRKALKAAMAIAPKSEKATYIVDGNLVILTSEKDKDTLRLSDDGQFAYGKLDEKTSFKLTRKK